MRNVHTKYKWVATDGNGKDHFFKVICTSYNSELGLNYFLKEIDHFADVPERFKYIVITKEGLKLACVNKPSIVKGGYVTYIVNEEDRAITIGNIGEICNDWQDSLIERPIAKKSSVEPTDLELMTIERDSYKKQCDNSLVRLENSVNHNSGLLKERTQLKEEISELKGDKELLQNYLTRKNFAIANYMELNNCRTKERDGYKSENNALKAEITILEGNLKQANEENRHSKLRFKDISELSQQINGLSK